MRRALATVVAVLLLVAPAVRAADRPAEIRYQTLLAAAKLGGPDIDWQALRLAYADSDEFDLFGARTDAARKAMFQALNTGDYKAAIASAQTIIDQDFVDIDAHVVSDLAYQQLGETAAAKRHHDIALGILRSIRTGDGSSPAQAFTVITVAEEYGVMRAFAMKVTGQDLVRDSGHSYDKLNALDPDGKPTSVFFLIDRVLAAESAAIKAKP